MSDPQTNYAPPKPLTLFAHPDGQDQIEYCTDAWILMIINEENQPAIHIGPRGLIELGWKLVSLGERLCVEQGVSRHE